MNLRPFAVLASAAVLVALTACSSPAPVTTSAAPTAAPASAAPSTAPSATPVAAGGLSFAAGNDLGTDLAKAPTFLNGFVNPTSGWTTSKETDSANGKYVFTSEDGLCTATLLQSRADGASFTVVEGDDRTSSTNALAWYFGDTPDVASQIPTQSTDATLPFGIGWEPGAPGADFRGVSAQTQNGGAFATYARVFGVPGVVLIASLSCTTADAFAAHAQNALLDSGVLTR